MPSLPEPRIDLNADVGEGQGEDPLFALISSANIACGGHAGSDATMREAVASALRHGVAVGAHPSYPDRDGFGRVTVALAPAALARTVASQIEALVRVARSLGTHVGHVKPHGALYNDAARDRAVAIAIAEAVMSVSNNLVLVGLAGSAALSVWSGMGLSVAREGFADRAYDPSGFLVPRSREGALITDPARAAAQASRLAASAHCETICIHSDTPNAAAIAAAVRAALEGAGFMLRGLSA